MNIQRFLKELLSKEEVVQDGKLYRREVTLFRREGDPVIVGEGLFAGDTVVLSKLDLMVDGMPVQVGN